MRPRLGAQRTREFSDGRWDFLRSIRPRIQGERVAGLPELPWSAVGQRAMHTLLSAGLVRGALVALLGTTLIITGATGAEKSAGARPAATRPAIEGKIDVNTADAETLESLPGVGPRIAKDIIAARPFKSVKEVEEVPGIGPARMADLKPYITVSKRRDAADSREASAESRSRRADLSETTRTPVRDQRGSVSSTAGQHRINLNTSSLEELEALPEIGPVKAQAIIDARPFKRTDDVMRVKGIKEATFEAIKDLITVR